MTRIQPAIQPPANARIERHAGGSVWLEDGMVCALSENCEHHTLQEALRNVEIITRLSGGARMALLVDFTGIKSMSREAREYYTRKEAKSYLLATAIITRSNLERLIANFFLGINRTPFPTRLFNDAQEARRWLGKQILLHEERVTAGGIEEKFLTNSN